MAKAVISVRIDPDLLAQVRTLAGRRRWSVSQWVAVAVERVAEAEQGKTR